MQPTYYTINEEAARLAHDMMSFSDYRTGSKTAEYRAQVDTAYAKATRQQSPCGFPLWQYRQSRIINFRGKCALSSALPGSSVFAFCVSFFTFRQNCSILTPKEVFPMLCPKCGAALEDFDVFCPDCGEAIHPGDSPAPADSPEPPPKKVAKKIYPPEPNDDSAPKSDPESAPESVSEPISKLIAESSGRTEQKNPESTIKKSKGLLISVIVLAVIAAVCLGITIYLGTQSHSLQVSARKASMEKASVEATLEDVQSQVSELEEKYQSLREENQSLSDKNQSLSDQILEMESDVSQSEYDKSAAQKELEEAQADLKSMNSTIEDLNAQLEEANSALEAEQETSKALTETNEALTEENKSYREEVGFYDTYVVFVMLGSETKYYHKYDCENFTKNTFLAYSTKLAEANGYSPCPLCCG